MQSMFEFKNTFIYNKGAQLCRLYNLLSTLFLKQTGDEWVLYKICSGDPLMSAILQLHRNNCNLIHCFLYVLCTLCRKLMLNGEDIFPCFSSRATVWI